ncbi:MAG: CBS domain-containing protein [Gammaproteobacteria bacterium]|jgi:acetoin utilization protein AcuB
MAEKLVHALLGECMTRAVHTVTPFDSLARAWELMMLNRVRHLPVLDKTKLVGIVSQRDLLDARPADPGHRLPVQDIEAQLAQLTVGVCMTQGPVVAYVNDTVGHAAELMLTHKIGALPVLNSEHTLAGLISETDIFRLLATRWREDNAGFSGAR